MAKFMLIYLGGEHPKTPSEGQKHFEEYRKWLTSLGDSVASAANPLKDTTVIHPDGETVSGSTTAMSGFSILEADTIEEAVTMSQTCPFLKIGGTLEVSELIEMQIENETTH